VSLVARLSATLSFWMPGDMMHIVLGKFRFRLIITIGRHRLIIIVI